MSRFASESYARNLSHKIIIFFFHMYNIFTIFFFSQKYLPFSRLIFSIRSQFARAAGWITDEANKTIHSHTKIATMRAANRISNVKISSNNGFFFFFNEIVFYTNERFADWIQTTQVQFARGFLCLSFYLYYYYYYLFIYIFFSI